jgi:hypothetical protein
VIITKEWEYIFFRCRMSAQSVINVSDKERLAVEETIPSVSQRWIHRLTHLAVLRGTFSAQGAVGTVAIPRLFCIFQTWNGAELYQMER